MEDFTKAYTKDTLSLLETNPNARLLDLGCHDGNLTSMIAAKIETNALIGMDRIDRGCKLPLVISDLERSFPLANKSFDVVCAIQVIEHVGNTDGLLQEIRRVLKDDGYAIISTPNLAAFTTIAFLLIGKQPTMISATDWRDGVINSFHRRVFTLSGLRYALAANGFYVEKEKCSCYYPLPTSLSGIMSRIDKRHTACMTMKVRKDLEWQKK